MLVSAISSNNGYNFTNGISRFNRLNEFLGEKVRNTSNPYFTRKDYPTDDDAPIVFDSINQWKKYCENNTVGEKLNIIA